MLNDSDTRDSAPDPAGIETAGTNRPLARSATHPSVIEGFRFIESFLLVVIALLTISAAGVEMWGVYLRQTIGLADILLMFLYTEVIGMIAVFYTRTGSPFVYPIFIAITALARLIVLQGKEMAPEKIVFEASAILLLAISTVVIMRARAA